MESTLPTLYQEQIHKTKYARWIDDLNRRENWHETVDRYLAFMEQQMEDHGTPIDHETIEDLRQGIINCDVMPSMRAMMTAGLALDRDHVAAFNCSYLTINRLHAFDEAMYILMCGTGVGFSVERQYINQLPEVPQLYETDDIISIADSKIGWASGLRRLISLLYAGSIPRWDTSKVRPAGSRLKTFGGRASGPGPLEDLFRYVVETFRNAQGRKLNSIECHGIMCKIGEVVIVGGVRRSALISLSNPSDDRMRDAKSGEWWNNHPEFSLANNSAAWTEKPSMERFIEEWTALIKSKSGERGIFSREAAQRHIRNLGRRDYKHEFGTNPCSEIILRDRQFCNLSEVVLRPQDDLPDIERKVRLATILGTLQATFTNFRYLSTQWSRNTEEEALLGVSLTGIMDHPIFNLKASHAQLSVTGISEDELAFDQQFISLPKVLSHLKQIAIDTNAEWADKLGINRSAAITCVKPSGTVSQLVDSASGIHPRYAQYYIRTNRGSKNDPVAQFLAYSGVPYEDDVMSPQNWVFSYPIKAPEGSVVVDDVSALEQLDLWLVYAIHWCEHKPSITVYVREDEWLEVGAFVYRNFHLMSGISFLPRSDHTHQQAPYQEISREQYEDAVANMPQYFDWSQLEQFEKEDTTENMKDLACTAGVCEL